MAQLERIREFFLLSLRRPQPEADSFDADDDSRPVGAMDQQVPATWSATLSGTNGVESSHQRSSRSVKRTAPSALKLCKIKKTPINFPIKKTDVLFCVLLLTLLGSIHTACSDTHTSGMARVNIFIYVFMPGTHMFPELLKEWVTCWRFFR